MLQFLNKKLGQPLRALQVSFALQPLLGRSCLHFGELQRLSDYNALLELHQHHVFPLCFAIKLRLCVSLHNLATASYPLWLGALFK